MQPPSHGHQIIPSTFYTTFLWKLSFQDSFYFTELFDLFHFAYASPWYPPWNSFLMMRCTIAVFNQVLLNLPLLHSLKPPFSYFFCHSSAFLPGFSLWHTADLFLFLWLCMKWKCPLGRSFLWGSSTRKEAELQLFLRDVVSGLNSDWW